MTDTRDNPTPRTRPPATGDRREPVPRAPSRRYSFTEVFVCRPAGDRLVGVHLRRGRSGISSARVAVADHKAADKLRGTFKRGCPFVVILPRSKYLLRVLDLPRVSQQELAPMLRLEVEASLPPGFDSVEISYRQIASDREGYQRYETYIARESDLAEHLAVLSSLELEPTLVLPSAVVWRALLDRELRATLLVAASENGWTEAAWLQANRTVSVRALEVDHNGTQPDAALVDCIRSALGSLGAGTEPIVVGWLGSAPPNGHLDPRVTFHDLGHDLLDDVAAEQNGFADDPLLYVAGNALLTAPDTALDAGNMLPREVTSNRQRRTLYRSMAAVACGCLLSLALCYLALQIAVSRYEQRNNALAGRIQLVRSEGEAVGRRLDQLRAMAATQSTRYAFHDVLQGLIAATPDGVSYNHVALDDRGIVRLRGQAASLSLPFQLPERLEQQPVFRGVSMRDAKQSKRGVGTTTEFGIEMNLNRVAQR